MCFSATASFTAAGLLGAVGALSVYKNKKNKRLPFAMVPLFFGLQQAAEGFVWLSLNGPEDACPELGIIGMYGFLVFAYMFWPIWMPLALWLRETSKEAKWWLSRLIYWGGAVAAYGGHKLVVNNITAQMVDQHIQYDIGVQGNVLLHIYLACYAVAVIVPFFISTMPYAKILGGLIAASLVYTYMYMIAAFTSVWCFFAAIISAFVLYIVWRTK